MLAEVQPFVKIVSVEHILFPGHPHIPDTASILECRNLKEIGSCCSCWLLLFRPSSVVYTENF